MDAEAIARGLSEAQAAYLHAVADAGKPYPASHHKATPVVMRRQLVEQVIEYEDGKQELWRTAKKPVMRRFKFVGQVPTPLGLSVRAILLRDQGDTNA